MGAGRSALAVTLALLAVGWLFTWWQVRVIERAFPPVGAFVDIDGARIHYTTRVPQGTPRATVLLLHGASGNQADLMQPLGDRLAALGFQVVAPDRPGHGWSRLSDGSPAASPPRQALLIRRAMEKIGVHRAIVVGHSWSGALAADFALDQPGFIEGLVLLSPVLYPWTTGIAWYYDPVTTPLVGPLFTHLLTLPIGLLSIDAGVAEVFAPQLPPPDFIARTGVELVLRPSEFTANAKDVSGLLAFVTAQASRIPEIRVPTAIVAGDGDHVVSPRIHAQHAAQDIPGATLTVLPGVGHSPHWAEPDAVVAAILSVAARIEAGRTVAAPLPVHNP